ncbi:MAG: hypothetical protein WD379_10835 [Dehalococcoidia bacterium]
MFSKDQTTGRVVCLTDYGRLKTGAIVPESNELYADVEAWLAEGNTLSEFDGYPEIPMTEEQLQDWRDNAVVTRFQARAALRQAGLREQVDAIIDDPETEPLVVDAWVDAQEFRRMSPTVLNLAAALGLTEIEVDDLFNQATTIEA